MKAKLVLVEWMDASLSVREQAQEDAERQGGEVVKTVGWLVVRDDDRLVIASEGMGGMWRLVTTIPSGTVREVVELRVRGKQQQEKEKP